MIWILWIYLALGLIALLRFNSDDLAAFVGIVIGMVTVILGWPFFWIVRMAIKRTGGKLEIPQ